MPELERTVLGNLGKRDAVDATQFADTQVRFHAAILLCASSSCVHVLACVCT